MGDYRLEAESGSLKGRIICGAGAGYEARDTFSLEEVLDFVEEINLDLTQKGSKTIPCFVKEGHIVGRASTASYRAKAYDFEFSWSPRVEPIEPGEFQEVLMEYALQLGNKLGQERVYVEFDGKTTVLRKK